MPLQVSHQKPEDAATMADITRRALFQPALLHSVLMPNGFSEEAKQKTVDRARSFMDKKDVECLKVTDTETGQIIAGARYLHSDF